MKHLKIVLVLLIAALGACSKSEPQPAPKVDANDTHPVKNVDALPSGTIREGAKTMNTASDLGKSLEQQKQDNEKNNENK